MLSNIFTGIFDTTGETVIAVPQFILCGYIHIKAVIQQAL